MKYKVIDDFPLETGKAGDPVIVKAGSVFIPAETNYPLDKVRALVDAGTIELLRDKVPAKKK